MSLALCHPLTSFGVLSLFYPRPSVASLRDFTLGYVMPLVMVKGYMLGSPEASGIREIRAAGWCKDELLCVSGAFGAGRDLGLIVSLFFCIVGAVSCGMYA